MTLPRILLWLMLAGLSQVALAASEPAPAETA